jgi:hypothetical protein
MAYDDYDSRASIDDLKDKTFDRVYFRSYGDSELVSEMVFENNEERYVFYHDQNCCESVVVEDWTGDVEDLQGSPLLMAEAVSNYDAGKKEEYDDSYTWTFYKFATIKGHVNVRWYGSSNGWYSESVDLGYEKVGE